MSEEYIADYLSAVVPLLAWVQSNDWFDAYQAHFDYFYEELANTFGESVSDVLAYLPTPLWARATRCCFEDFLTTDYDSDPRNVLDHYLDVVGMDLEEADVDFLIAFRRSVVSVYHVIERTPFGTVTLRDVSGGTGPVEIEDENATAALVPGDTISTRIVTFNGMDYHAGSILVLSETILETFKEGFEGAVKEEINKLEKYLRKDLRQMNLARQRVIRSAAPVLAGMWVLSCLEALDDAPLIANDDESDAVFEATVSYSSTLESVIEWLDAHPDTDRPIDKEFLWFWLNDRENPDASMKAMVWISGDEIWLESSAASRIEEVAKILLVEFGDANAEIIIRVVGDDNDDEIDWDEDEQPASPLTDEEISAQRELIHQNMDVYLRQLLDMPVEELKNQVPREMAKSAKGRKRLIKWLSAVQETFRKAPAQACISDYDLSWIGKELNLDIDRQSSLFD